MCRWERGGGEIPKRGRLRRARSLEIWPRGGGGGRYPWGFGPGGSEITGGGEIPGRPDHAISSCKRSFVILSCFRKVEYKAHYDISEPLMFLRSPSCLC